MANARFEEIHKQKVDVESQLKETENALEKVLCDAFFFVFVVRQMF